MSSRAVLAFYVVVPKELAKFSEASLRFDSSMNLNVNKQKIIFEQGLILLGKINPEIRWAQINVGAQSGKSDWSTLEPALVNKNF